MQTIAAQLEQAFRTAIREAFGLEADPLISVAQNDKFGDYQSNAAMGLAKQVSESTGQGSTSSPQGAIPPQGKTNPRAVAEQVKAKVTPLLADLASEITIAGPGFINVRLKPEWVASQLQAIAADDRLGSPLVASPKKVVVDYSGPNVAKQMHVGHLRSTIIGDAISRVIEFQGHEVIRQNHIGDWGTQFGMLITYLRSLGGAGDANISDLDRFYKEARKRFESDPAFADEARKTVVSLQAGGQSELELWRKIVAESRRHFEPIYKMLGVQLVAADEKGESFYNPMLAATVNDLKARGIAKESQGAVVVFTDGIEAPLIVEKSGGGFGYATTDLAAIRYRVQTLGASRIIYFVGAPQAQHFKQVFAAARDASWAVNVLLEHAAFGSVLGEDGKMFKARSGDSVKLADLLSEAVDRALSLVVERNQELAKAEQHAVARAVGIGAVKYADLSKDRITDYVFSWDRALAMDGNTAPYLQYAYARIRSIFRKAGVEPSSVISVALNLNSPYELALAKHIFRLGEVIELVGRELKPHHLCTYLYELATRFSSFYENCPVLQSEEPTRSSRLLLCDVTARALALGLDQIGIEHPEQM